MIDQDSACGEYESKLLWKMVISTADGSLAAVDNHESVFCDCKES